MILDLAIELVHSNGLIVIDDTLWDGKLVDQSDTSENTVAIRQINDFVRDDQRIDVSFLCLGDGTTLCRNKLTNERHFYSESFCFY